MNGLKQSLVGATAVLNSTGIGFALVGALAVSVRTEPRFTADCDLAVAVTNDDEAEAVVRAFISSGHTVLGTVEHDVANRLATARLRPEGEWDTVVDLLFASTGIEPEIVAGAETMEVLPELVLPVATTGYLMAMKVLAVDDTTRPTDAADLRALSRIARDADWSEARTAAELITARGFNRGRDLNDALAALRAEADVQ